MMRLVTLYKIQEEADRLSPDKMQVRKKYVKVLCGIVVLLCLGLGACGNRQEESSGEDTSAVNEAAQENDTAAENKAEAINDTEKTAGEALTEKEGTETASLKYGYEGTIAAPEADVNEESGYFGIMYATIVEINGNAGESSTMYTFRDKADPDNVWSFTGLEIGDMEVTPEEGQNVVILFNGDIINDSENVEFMVILPDGEYKLKRTEGKTSDNMMSTFSIDTIDGERLQFLKDNCKADEDAMKSEGGDSVIVYYAENADGTENYPLRIYKGR